MKIGILGSGYVGGQLGRGWASKGHAVMFSSRTPASQKIIDLLPEVGGNASAGTLHETMTFADVIAIAMPWNAIPQVVQQAGSWQGKIIIDANNRFGASSATSAAQDLAQLAVGARVVKAFNTIGANRFTKPYFDDQNASMFICGDDADAKAIVTQLAADLGFDVVDAGGLNHADLLEELARLWVTLSQSGLGREIGFKLLRE